MQEKQRRGAPTKAQQIRNKISRMEESLEEAILKGNQKIVGNYLKYLKVLDDAALGTLKGCSPTNQISSAKVLMEKCESILEEGKVHDKSQQNDNAGAHEDNSSVAKLISLKAVGDD